MDYIKQCEDYLWELEHDALAFTSGRRNDDCVNSMIVCYALGMEWELWYTDYWKMNPMVKEHHDRIEPYLDGWFKNSVEEALSYMV